MVCNILYQGYSIGGPRSGSGPRRNQIWTEAKINILIKSWSKRVFIGASFHWCMISRCIFFSYSMWFLSSVSNPEVQSGAVITTSLWQLIHSMLAASSVGHAGCVCQWQQRGQIDLWTVSFSQQTKIMACFKPDKKRKVDSKNGMNWQVCICAACGSTKPMCLICNETVALVKSSNVKRHYATKHAHFEQKYSEVRGRKINHLQSYKATCSVIVRSTTQQERAYLNIHQNQNHVYWPSTFSYTRLLSMYLNWKYAV